MRTNINIHDPKLFEVRPPLLPNDGPRLWIDTGKVIVFFDSWKRFEKLKDEVNRAWYAFQAEEEQRQAEANIDDEASGDGDRNHELTVAMGAGGSMSALPRELSYREQVIHDNLVEKWSAWSRQVQALAKAVAIELPGLERKVDRD